MKKETLLLYGEDFVHSFISIEERTIMYWFSEQTLQEPLL